jgi:hypothetical protein
MKQSEFDQSNFNRSKLVYCTLDHSVFARYGNSLRDCFLYDTSMRYMTADHLYLFRSTTLKTSFDNSRISRLELFGSTFVASSFCGMRINELHIHNSSFERCTFTGTRIGTLYANPWNRLYLAYRGAYWKNACFIPTVTAYDVT